MKLKSVAIDITYKCNFRCKHCYNSSGEHQRNSKELSDDEILKIVDEICDYYPESICMCGGETLLRVELICKVAELVNKKSNGKISLNMVTNGYLLTRELAEKLKKSGVEHIQLSLDGMTKQSHNWLRNNDQSFEKVLSAMKYVNEQNIILGIACAPTKKNIKEIPSLIDYCYRNKVDTLRFQPLMIMGRGSQLKKYELTKLEYFKLSDYINKVGKENKYNGMSIEWGDPLEHLGLISNGHQEYVNWTINAYGEIMFSPYVPVTIGNLKNHTVKEYVDKGIIDIVNDQFIMKCSSILNEWSHMEMKEYNSIIPKLGMEDYINYDILDKELHSSQLIDLVNKI